MSIWIDDLSPVGTVGFLISTEHYHHGVARYYLDDRPAVTNQSFEPRLTGWCGSWNDVSTNACGLAKVTKVAGNGRALVRRLKGDEEQAALESFGYPDLS